MTDARRIADLSNIRIISECPCMTEPMDVASSGSDVPSETIVTPIMKEGMRKCRPIFSAVSVK